MRKNQTIEEDDNIIQNIGKYGVVQIIDGMYKGRFGYYDDDDDYDKHAIIYFGKLLLNSEYVLIKYKYLKFDYTFESLTTRSNKINSLLWAKLSDSKRLSLIEEKNLIDTEINNILIKNKYGTCKIKTKVFLSHSSLDKGIVIPISIDLKLRGINTWIDSFDILPGKSLIKKISDGLIDYDYGLLFVSNNSIKSNWVFKEWETMLCDEINTGTTKIIPIKLDDCEMPTLLKTKKYIDFSGDYDLLIAEIVDTINSYNKLKNQH